jgi:hypothetical protein
MAKKVKPGTVSFRQRKRGTYMVIGKPVRPKPDPFGSQPYRPGMFGGHGNPADQGLAAARAAARGEYGDTGGAVTVKSH